MHICSLNIIDVLRKSACIASADLAFASHSLYVDVYHSHRGLAASWLDG